MALNQGKKHRKSIPKSLRRTKRATNRPDRLGRRISSYNKDNLFMEIDETHHPEQIDHESSSCDGLELVEPNCSGSNGSDFNQLILNKLNEISVRIELLEKIQVQTAVERRLSSDSTDSNVTERFQALETFGLPVKSKEDLDNLEYNLTKSDVLTNMVSSNLILHLIHIFCFF